VQSTFVVRNLRFARYTLQ